MSNLNSIQRHYNSITIDLMEEYQQVKPSLSVVEDPTQFEFHKLSSFSQAQNVKADGSDELQSLGVREPRKVDMQKIRQIYQNEKAAQNCQDVQIIKKIKPHKMGPKGQIKSSQHAATHSLDMRSLQRINALLEKYRRNSKGQNKTDIGMVRAKAKDRLFYYMLYGVQELKKCEFLTAQEQKLKLMSNDQLYIQGCEHADQFQARFYIFIRGKFQEEQQLNQYKERIQKIVSNLGDFTNTTLRRKLLNHTITPEQLPYIPQKDLLSERQKSLEKAKIEYLMNQNTVKNEVIQPEEEQVITMGQIKSFQEESKIQSKKSSLMLVESQKKSTAGDCSAIISEIQKMIKTKPLYDKLKQRLTAQLNSAMSKRLITNLKHNLKI